MNDGFYFKIIFYSCIYFPGVETVKITRFINLHCKIVKKDILNWSKECAVFFLFSSGKSFELKLELKSACSLLLFSIAKKERMKCLHSRSKN